MVGYKIMVLFFSHTQEFYNSIGRLIFSSDMSRVIIPPFAVNLKKEKEKKKVEVSYRNKKI